MLTRRATNVSGRQARPFSAGLGAPRGAVRVQAGEGGPSPAPPQPAAQQRPPGPPRPAAAPGPRPGAPRPGAPSRPGMPAAPPGFIMGPDGQPLEVVAVEKAGEEAWAGVAQVDRGASSEFDAQSAALLAAGDLVALLVFAAAGRANHGGEGLASETLGTALPFVLGWFATAPLLGGFGAAARKQGVPAAALTAAKCWAVGIPAGLLLRGLLRGYVPPPPFILVSLAVNGVLLLGWRSALAAATKPDEPDSVKSRKDRRGNPFEFLSLLMSLTKRW